MKKGKIKSKIKILKGELEELWKMACLIRDKFECQLCGSKNNLQVHHVVSRANMATKFDVENGITLCQRCHAGISLNSYKRNEFTIWFIKKFGLEKLEELQEKARTIKRWTVGELEEEIEKLKNYIKSLKGN